MGNSNSPKTSALQLNPQDAIPPALEAVFQACWSRRYIDIDLDGHEDFSMAAQAIVDGFVSSFGEGAERPLLAFFIALSKKAQMWLRLSRPKDKNPARLMKTATHCLTTGHILSAAEADQILPPQEQKSSDINADEAYVALRFLAHSLDPIQLRALAVPFLEYALTSYAIVIPEGQRRNVLQWCLEEGLPAVWANRKPNDVGEYLYRI